MKYITVTLFTVVFVLSAEKCAGNIHWPNCDEMWPTCESHGRGRNTVCISPHCGGRRVNRCIEIKPGPMMRRAVLEAHNDKRDLVASGGDLRNNMTGAKDMRAFSYDLGLEYTAICHVNRCIMEHDKCRGTKKFPRGGQNLAKQGFHPNSKYLKEVLNVNVTKAFVVQWYDTEILLNTDWTASIAKYYFYHPTGHLTALVWANTTHVGCSRAMWNQSSNRVEYHITCNYAPPGNVINSPMFTPGKPGEGATACPNGTTRNSKYSSLCGKIDDSQVNTGDNPYRAKEQDATQARPLPFIVVSGFILIIQFII